MNFKFTELQEAWLQDLETTEAKQCTGSLRKGDGYCCLGRACVVLGIPDSSPDDVTGTFEGNDVCLPLGAWKALGLSDMKGTLVSGFWNKDSLDPTDDSEYLGHRIESLISMNDETDWTFKQIAAYIRENPENVFMPRLV